VLPADLFRSRTIAALAPLAQRLPAFDAEPPAADRPVASSGVIAVGLGEQQALSAIKRLANVAGAGGGAPAGAERP
jgi:hypothetical protein